jgi:hypothetical protein
MSPILVRRSIRRRLGGSTDHPTSAAHRGIVPRGAPWPQPGNQGGWEGRGGHRGRGVGRERWAWHDPGGREGWWVCRRVARAGADCATGSRWTGDGGAKVVVVTSNGSDLHVAQLAPNGPSFGPRTRSVLGGVFWGGWGARDCTTQNGRKMDVSEGWESPRSQAQSRRSLAATPDWTNQRKKNAV